MTFKCAATANPSAVIKWIKAGNVLSNSSNNGAIKHIITNRSEGDCEVAKRQSVCLSYSELTIINIEPFDDGDYVCDATNKDGHTAKNATLIVRGKLSTGQTLRTVQLHLY